MSVAICFHLGYIGRFNEFTPYIDNVINALGRKRNIDIYITYREDQDPTNMCLGKYPKAILLKATHGCDIGAFFAQIKYMLNNSKNYKYIFKLHTKSGNIHHKTWCTDLLEKTAGSQLNVKKIINTFKKHRHSIGMIGSKKWILKREINYQIFKDLCTRNKVNDNGYFIGGTIFWVKFSIIKNFFTKIDIDKEYLSCELGKPTEPSYTHSWERILGLIVSSNGYKIYGI